MTTTQISYILNTYGYTAKKWTPLDKFSVIFLGQDANVYLNPKTKRVRFDTTNSLLEIVEGHTSSDGTFVSRKGETNNYTPTAFIDFEIIDGFLQSVEQVGCISPAARPIIDY